MQTTQALSRLPGVRASTLFLINVLVSWAILLLYLLLLGPLIGLMTVEATRASGHLPWPVAQWALTTPARPRVRRRRAGGTPAFAGGLHRRLPAILAPDAVATGIRCFDTVCRVFWWLPRAHTNNHRRPVCARCPHSSQRACNAAPGAFAEAGARFHSVKAAAIVG